MSSNIQVKFQFLQPLSLEEMETILGFVGEDEDFPKEALKGGKYYPWRKPLVNCADPVKILKHCPKGTRLYKISDSDFEPIPEQEHLYCWQLDSRHSKSINKFRDKLYNLLIQDEMILKFLNSPWESNHLQEGKADPNLEIKGEGWSIVISWEWQQGWKYNIKLQDEKRKLYMEAGEIAPLGNLIMKFQQLCIAAMAFRNNNYSKRKLPSRNQEIECVVERVFDGEDGYYKLVPAQSFDRIGKSYAIACPVDKQVELILNRASYVPNSQQKLSYRVKVVVEDWKIYEGVNVLNCEVVDRQALKWFDHKKVVHEEDWKNLRIIITEEDDGDYYSYDFYIVNPKTLEVLTSSEVFEPGWPHDRKKVLEYACLVVENHFADVE